MPQRSTAPRSTRLARWLPPLALAGLAVFLHWPAAVVFKADDYPILRYVSDWGRCLSDFVGPQYGLAYFEFYRPFITLSFGIELRLFGPNATGFYATNTAAVAVSAVLLFALLTRLSSGNRGFAFVATCLWLSHPSLVTAQRCWAAGRVDSHLVPPLLLALFLHLRSRRGGARWPVWIAALWAFGTKELAIGFPLIALALDLLDPEPTERRGPRLFGKTLVAAPLLLLLPLFFLARLAFLGQMVGGYHAFSREPFVPLEVVRGVAFTFGANLLPGTPTAVQLGGAIAAVVALAVWCWRSRGERVARAAAALAIGAGLYAPLAQLLPLMVGKSDQRWAYTACAGILTLWAAVAFAVARGRRPLAFALGLAPLLWLVPARTEERGHMDGHDRFARSLVAAMKECDALLGPGDPVVLGGEGEHAMHPYRFAWGIGSILEPPFHDSGRDAVNLGVAGPFIRPPDQETVCSGLAAWIEVFPDRAELVRGEPGPREAVPPVGFDGVLSAELLGRMLHPEVALGYAVGEGYDGSVNVCTTIGSLSVDVPAKEGLLHLRDVLAASAVGELADHPPVADLVWIPADLDDDCPVVLIWREAEGVRVATLRLTPDYAREYARLMWGE